MGWTFTVLSRHAVTKTADVLGLGGNVIAWFASYLTGRTQYVRIATSRSISLAVLFGVPQSSVLGPILFLLYVADLLQLVKRHGLHPHCYADDTQIYGFCDPSDVDALQERLSVCIDEVFSWMMSNHDEEHNDIVTRSTATAQKA